MPTVVGSDVEHDEDESCAVRLHRDDVHRADMVALPRPTHVSSLN